ncbi:nucleotidyltransferase family protein [Sporosarcina luteola]|uniref:nucleotidyltransferase family protein n=1 Tax=Sporosarcina luteola TaxID=582850 RepID=UPI002041606F|nr:nucleotidyltransferase family protein [Sporosarcina luteola]
MGRNKLALAVGKMTLGSLALDTAVQSALDRIFIISNERDDLAWLPARLKMHEKCKMVKCRDAGEGQSASIRCGIEYAIEAGASAIVILLADQPFITSRMIDEMVACWKLHPTSKYISTTHDGTMKPPILITKELFPNLLKIRGDQGARKVLRGEFLEHGKQLPCTDARLVFDVDDADDYSNLLSKME